MMIGDWNPPHKPNMNERNASDHNIKPYLHAKIF